MINLIIGTLVFFLVVMSIIAHEISHGFVAYFFGDDTARNAGRLSFNPIRHIDPFGTIGLPLILKLSGSPVVFGWAKPVPVNYYKLRRPIRSMMLVALAGPVTNICLALIFAVVTNMCNAILHAEVSLNVKIVTYVISSATMWAVFINLFLACFNLIPIPPLDGSRVLRFFLTEDLRYYFDKLERYGMLLIVIFLMFGDPVFNVIQTVILRIMDIILIS